MFRGSRKHVLDWADQPGFVDELIDLARPIRCRKTPDSIWQPLGTGAPNEARLESFGPRALPGHPAWPILTSWWLQHPRGANTPNWDIALSAEIEGRPGLILVEAKANVPELSVAGKSDPGPNASTNSSDNHTRIGQAIEQARVAMSAALLGIAISRNHHYQLSNRLAFAWRLASLGIPTVLIYLGFVGDTGIVDAGEPFSGNKHWRTTFADHLSAVCPLDALNGPIDAGEARFWLLLRSRPVLQVSPPPSCRA